MTKITAIIGANYGDEGKGLATAYFTKLADDNHKRTIVVLTNGGAQRGHTVESMLDGSRHVFHHFNSKRKRSYADLYFPSLFIINPIEFIKEREDLLKDGHYIPRAYCHKDSLVTTPYDIFANQIFETNRGKSRHGSTGMGIWTTMCRHRAVPLTFSDLDRVEKKLDDIVEYTLQSLEGQNIPDDYMKLFKSDGLRQHFIKDCFDMKTSVNEAKDDAFLSKYEEVIFENAQGLLLSYREGDMHTTPSFTGMENINEIAKSISNVEESEICYVTRSYLTRHGAGPFPTECDVRKLNPDIIDNTNVHNPWQESIRYGMLDINELNERITADFAKCKLQNAKKSVMMTHLNEFDMETDEIDGLNYTSYDRFFENVHATKR